MKEYVFLLLILLLNACSLLKNTSHSINQSQELLTNQTNLKMLEEKDWGERSNRLIFSTDSSDQQFTIQIWPKGLFTYSPAKGFSGTADRVQIVERLKSSGALVDVVQLAQQDKKNVAATIGQLDKKATDQQIRTTKSSPSYKWMLAGLAFILILVFGGYSLKKLT